MVSKKDLREEIGALEINLSRVNAKLDGLVKSLGFVMRYSLIEDEYQACATKNNLFELIFNHLGLRPDDSLRLIEKGEEK